MSRQQTEKCEYCGRFVNLAKAVLHFTPDSYYTAESNEAYHSKCWEKLQAAGSKTAKPTEPEIHWSDLFPDSLEPTKGAEK